MKRITATALAALIVTVSFADTNVLQKAWLKGTTDKDPLSYKPGEEMVFTVAPQNIRGDIPMGTYFLKWERTGDDGVSENGSEPLTGKPFVYKTRIAKPGFVRLFAEVVDASGQPFMRRIEKPAVDPNTPEGRRALKRLRKIKKNVFFDGGAAAGVDTLRQAAPEPADFDAFWARQKAELAKVPFNAKRVEVPCGNPDVRLYALSVDCTGGMPVTGYLSIPKAAEKGRKCGINIQAFGYGVGEQSAPRRPSADAIEFKMNAHGFLLREFGGTDEYYRTYGDKIKSNGYTYAFDPQQNSNPETAYFRGMILRMIRAIQYTKSMPEWDGKNLHVYGNSQGGAFAIWAAGCGEGVTSVLSTVTGFCDVGAELAGRLRGPWPCIKYVEALGYFDPVNFAKRIPGSCYVDIARAGLGDYTCQPSGLAILWNNLKCPKRIVWMQGSEHSYVPPEYEGRDTVRREGVDADARAGVALKVGTYNIRNAAADKRTPNAWDLRKADMVELVRRMDLDAFGLQEVLPVQVDYLTNGLPQYAFVGEYRNADRVSGEASPVFYRKDRLEALKCGTFWLSETPDVPGRKGWGAACPRVCSWALLRDRQTGKAFCFANTHTDHISYLARREGMLLILRRMHEFAPSGTPIVFTGDHNCRESEEPAQAVSKLLKNALYISETPPTGPWRTFTGWRWRDEEVSTLSALRLPVAVRNARKGSPDAEKSTNGGHVWEDCGARIDYIYVSDGVEVKSYATRGDARPGEKLYPSDHFPVTAVIEL